MSLWLFLWWQKGTIICNVANEQHSEQHDKIKTALGCLCLRMLTLCLYSEVMDISGWVFLPEAVFNNYLVFFWAVPVLVLLHLIYAIDYHFLSLSSVSYAFKWLVVTTLLSCFFLIAAKLRDRKTERDRIKWKLLNWGVISIRKYLFTYKAVLVRVGQTICGKKIDTFCYYCFKVYHLYF